MIFAHQSASRVEMLQPQGSKAQGFELYPDRYVVYIEAEAWATNFKHKLASGSVVFTPGMKHAEFFGRALVAGVHHVPIGAKHMCEELVDKVKSC